MKPRHVFVLWEDITAQQGWVSKKRARKGKPARVWSSGFVVSDTKKQMILAQNYGEDHEVNGREVLPRGCVLRIIESPLPFDIPEESEE